MWKDLRSFLEVARQQSFSKGAQAIGASHMARAVRRLETRLGVTLVVAFDTGIELTKDGRALAEKLEPLIGRFLGDTPAPLNKTPPVARRG
jgi:DNA-binding transcriptional LysR family regulator